MLYNTSCFTVAFAGLFGATTISHAAIVYSQTVNLAIPVASPGLYLNIQTGASGTSAAAVPGWNINVGGTSSLNFSTPGGYNFVRLNTAAPTAGPSNLIEGFNVSVNPTFMPTASWIAGGAASGLTLNSTENYIGFQFTVSGGTTHVGYLRLSIGSSVTGADRKIVSYAYNSESITTPGGASIVVMPAPGALAMLCGAGVLAKRRRR
jgi:hypothetical protein